MAWHLAGLGVVHGATRRPPEVSAHGLGGGRGRVTGGGTLRHRADRQGDAGTMAGRGGERSLYVLDVRTPEEYEAGHLRGARSVPGGQLVQETDVACRDLGRAHRAGGRQRRSRDDDRILAETDGMEGSRRFRRGASDGDWETGPRSPAVLGLEAARGARSTPRRCASDWPRAITVIDLDFSRRYVQGHIPGAWFAIRSRLADAVAKFPAVAIVLTSPDGRLAALAAAELSASFGTGHGLSGGTQSGSRPD